MEDPPLLPTASRPSTPEYPPENNSMISSPRSESSRPSTPTTPSLATVPLASISSARACYRFFNSRLSTVYESCVLPTETVFAASHSICSSTYSVRMKPRSSLRQVTYLPPPPSVILQRTFSLSSPFLALASTEPEALAGDGGAGAAMPMKRTHDGMEIARPTQDSEKKKEEKPLLRAMHIRMRLTSGQRREVKKRVQLRGRPRA